MNERNYGDREQLTDLLNSQKFITGLYNSNLNESSTPDVRKTLSSILEEEQCIQNQIFTAMNERGYYPVCRADEQKITKAKNQYDPSSTGSTN